MGPRPVFLDVDPSIVERNLQITEDPGEEELKKLFPSEEQYPSKVVKPFPGFCIKSKEVGTEVKVFVNICHTNAIPPPRDISEEELVELCSTDEPADFRIPMSIGEVRSEPDKRGSDAKAVDVAINPQFFGKVEGSSLFKNFLMAVVFEGLRNKHGLHTTDDRIMLKNRKAYGTLQLHRIQQRDVDQKMGRIDEASTSAMETLTGSLEVAPTKPKIETLSSVSYEEHDSKLPEYRLFKKIGEPQFLVAEAKLPNVFDSKELTLDIGEDRIILESKDKGYFLDVFVPYTITQDTVTSTFDKNSKILTITMPIKSA